MIDGHEKYGLLALHNRYMTDFLPYDREDSPCSDHVVLALRP